jgi:DNA-binding CsgD family transcriptional regulator
VHVERSIATTALYVESVESACSHSTMAVEAAEQLGDSGVLAYALATDALVRTVAGDPLATEVLAAAVAHEPDEDPLEIEWSPRAVAADCARITLSLENARAGFARIHELAVARGDFRAELWSAYGSGQVAIDAGAWKVAQELCGEVNELTQQSGLMVLPALRLGARLAAHRGDAERCRALTGQCLADARAGGERLHELMALMVLGALELSAGDVEAGARTLGVAHAIATELGVGAPGMLRFVVDQAEALAGVGRLDEADAALLTFERRAEALELAWARPLLDRARGLTAAARGDLDGGATLLRRAEAARDDLPLPLERARIDLCLGRVLRRLKRRAEAREALDRAVAAFDSLGSRLWAEQSRAERARIGGRSRRDGLTATEAQVAALVAEGRTNKEVAAALFVTANTVEAHLTRVYAKLGVRSRNELARALSEQGPGVSSLSAADGSS